MSLTRDRNAAEPAIVSRGVKTLVWFRGKDLRLHDHAALRDAAEQGDVLPLFVLELDGARPHHEQLLLDALDELKDRVVIERGDPLEVVPRLFLRWKADRVVALRRVEPSERERERRMRELVPLELFEGETLLPPGTLRNGSGEPYSIYTPFSRAFARLEHVGRPLGPVRLKLRAPARLPKVRENRQLLRGGERAARARLEAFDPSRYAQVRSRLDLDATSRLSADLRLGTVSVREVWSRAAGSAAFRNELVWRDYTHSTLWDFPDALTRPLREAWRGFPYRDDEKGWKAWTSGTTGYPVVDAAQRQLLAEGFVHNRARMITASFLSRHLMIDFRRGEAWFMKWLADGDEANNDAGWQWSFGCGLDAQPYFRVFSPTAQRERFDLTGAYVKRWVPEAGTRDYPSPIVDDALARERFVSTLKRHLRQSRSAR